MAGQRIVIKTANQLHSNGFGYKQEALIVRNVIDFFIAGLKACLAYSLGLAVVLLQLVQPEPYTTNTGFIKLLISKLGLEDTPKTPELWQSVGSADEELMLGREARKRGVET